MDNQDFRYWAFVSYSSADSEVCKKLHKALEQYKVPAPLVGKNSRGEPTPAKIFPVFRDRDEFPLNANLGSSIENALELSRYLIVLCSKTAAKSQWVNEEIRYFKSLGREDRVLAIIVDGVPNSSDIEGNEHNECFPKALRYALDTEGQISENRVEPIAGDLRTNGDGWNKSFLKCVAGILGVGLDEIIQRDKVAQAKRKRFQLSSLAAGIVLFSVLFLGYFSANESASKSAAISESLKNGILCEDVKHSDLEDAVVVGDYDAAVDALANGDDINKKSCERQTTLLQKGIMAGHGDMVDWLLENGADPYLTDNTGYIAIHYAVMAGKKNIPAIFVKHEINLSEPIEIITGSHVSTLNLAAKMGQSELVEELIKFGVPIVASAKHRGFRSALTNAAAADNVDIVRYLLEKGADPYFEENLGTTTTTPIKIARSSGANATIDLFAEYDKKRGKKPSSEDLNASLLQIIDMWGDISKIEPDTIRKLLEQGADPFRSVQKNPGVESIRDKNSVEAGMIRANIYCAKEGSSFRKRCERYKDILSIFLENGIDEIWLEKHRQILKGRFSKLEPELKKLFIDAGIDMEMLGEI
jgi:ankyrin repeat protein